MTWQRWVDVWRRWCDEDGVTKMVWRRWCDEDGVTKMVWRRWCDEDSVTKMVWRRWCDEDGVTKRVWWRWCDEEGVTKIVWRRGCDEDGVTKMVWRPQLTKNWSSSNFSLFLFSLDGSFPEMTFSPQVFQSISAKFRTGVTPLSRIWDVDNQKWKEKKERKRWRPVSWDKLTVTGGGFEKTFYNFQQIFTFRAFLLTFVIASKLVRF